MTDQFVRRDMQGAAFACVSSAVVAALLLAAPLAMRGDVIGAVVYAAIFFPLSLTIVAVVGVPAFLLALKFGGVSATLAAAFGGAVGGILGLWIGSGRGDAVVFYAAVGVLCGVVFQLVQSRFSRSKLPPAS